MTTEQRERAAAPARDANELRARRFGIDTQHEAVVFMRKDCAVCRSEGFTAHARVLLARGERAVLQGTPDAPLDLRERALALAGTLLELAGGAAGGRGGMVAARTLQDGSAWRKFQQICEAQGGMREPPAAGHRRPVPAARPGRVSAIDNRRLAKVAKLAGAPDAKAAGVELQVRLGAEVARGEPLYTVHAETPGELAYSLDYVAGNDDIIELTEA